MKNYEIHELKIRKTYQVNQTTINDTPNPRASLVSAIRLSKNGKYFLKSVYSGKYPHYELILVKDKLKKDGSIRSGYSYCKRVNMV